MCKENYFQATLQVDGVQCDIVIDGTSGFYYSEVELSSGGQYREITDIALTEADICQNQTFIELRKLLKSFVNTQITTNS